VNLLLVLIFSPLLLGELIWRVQRGAEHQRRAQRLEAERQRQSIARDLHDTLAYSTTAMVMKAEQARLRGGQDEQTLADLDYIASTGRSTTADLRTILALLRESPKDAQPGGASLTDHGIVEPTRLEEVLEGQRAKLAAFNFDVHLSINGDPAILPDHLTTVLARSVTEMASNITKHGDPDSEVSIMIDIGPDDVELVAVNGLRPSPTGSGQRGLGLLGLREVVEGVAGNFESGQMGTRWITHLTLPLRERDRG
jgi:signal transduction histidine kinase